MKTLMILFLMLGGICQAQSWNRENEIAYKFHQDSTGFYLIKYEYDPDFCTIPLTLPAGEPHYFALITVYQVVENDTIQVGQPFDGTYVEKGCFEDVPEDQVKRAKNIVDVIETVPIKEFEVDSTYSWDYAFDADSILPEKPQITFITLESLVDYQKYCYNDTVFAKDEIVYRTQGRRPYKKPSLDGFIEYMKRKSR